MRFDRSVEILAPGDVALCPDRVSSDRKALRDKTTRGVEAEIVCPGGCGGSAILEPPMTITKGKLTRTVQVARCQEGCRTEVKSRSGKLKSIPTQFEIVLNEETASAAGESTDELAELLRSALATGGVKQAQAASEIGCSQSVISKILHGHPVAEKTSDSAREWATRKILFGQTELPTVWDQKQDTDQEFPEKTEPTVEMVLTTPRPKKSSAALRATPYETVIRTILEEVAQKRFEELAGDAAKGIVVKVHLEWSDNDD